MNEFLNQYAGWVSIVSLLLSIPLGVLTNLLTPKVKAWLATRSENSLEDQIQYLQKQIIETDRLVKEPAFAVAKFTNIQFRALMGPFIVLFLVLILVVGAMPTMLNVVDVNAELTTGELIASILRNILGGAFVAFLASGKIIQLYAMTHRVETYPEWRKETIDEIDNLKRRKLKKRSAIRRARAE